MDALNTSFLTNVKCEKWSFKPKAVFLGLMVRKLIQAEIDPRYIDDKDYYGNKRLELAGQMLAYIFEDSLKKLNTEIETIANKMLPRPKANQFDVLTHIRPDMIARDFEYALSTVILYKRHIVAPTNVITNKFYLGPLPVFQVKKMFFPLNLNLEESKIKIEQQA